MLDEPTNVVLGLHQVLHWRTLVWVARDVLQDVQDAGSAVLGITHRLDVLAWVDAAVLVVGVERLAVVAIQASLSCEF